MIRRTSTASRTRTAAPIRTNDHDGIPRRRRQVARLVPRGQGRASRTRTAAPRATKNDRDGDGILDNVDKCPDDPEDFDGFQDEDGCPDPDNDQDGILDVGRSLSERSRGQGRLRGRGRLPRSRQRQGTASSTRTTSVRTSRRPINGFEDEDGCPDRGRVVVTDTSIENPRHGVLRVQQGHHQTDLVPDPRRGRGDAAGQTRASSSSRRRATPTRRGDDAYNLDLSDRRSKAVEESTSSTRASTRSGSPRRAYGETQPLEPAPQRRGLGEEPPRGVLDS